MSLQLVTASIDDPRDREDLLTIYEHGREERLHLPQLAECSGNAPRLLRHVADHDELDFYAVRFNDRLIAACVVARSSPGSAAIDGLHVRSSSAGRGVEERFLRMLTQALAPEVDEISVHLEPDKRQLLGDTHIDGFERDRDWHEEVRYRRVHARPE